MHCMCAATQLPHLCQARQHAEHMPQVIYCPNMTARKPSQVPGAHLNADILGDMGGLSSSGARAVGDMFSVMASLTYRHPLCTTPHFSVYSIIREVKPSLLPQST